MAEQDRITHSLINQDSRGIGIRLQQSNGITEQPLTRVVYIDQNRSEYPTLHEINKTEPEVLPRVINSIKAESGKDGVAPALVDSYNHAKRILGAIVFPDGKPSTA